MTHPASLELISFWTFTGVTSWAVNALILTHVAGEAAFINVCAGNIHTHKHTLDHRQKAAHAGNWQCGACSQTRIYRQSHVCVVQFILVCVCVFTLTRGRVLCQLIALFTLAEEGANQVVAVLLTGILHITFIYI